MVEGSAPTGPAAPIEQDSQMDPGITENRERLPPLPVPLFRQSLAHYAQPPENVPSMAKVAPVSSSVTTTLLYDQAVRVAVCGRPVDEHNRHVRS